jgi:hypothetical protein
MDMTDRIESYLRGWTTGDASLLLKQTAESFFFDDPNRGRILRSDYESYVSEIKSEANEFRAGRRFENFENLSDIVVKENDDRTTTVWFWWEIAGTPIEGSSLVRIGEAGVLSETICYYGKAAYAKRTK